MYKKKKSKAWIWLVLLILVVTAGVAVYQDRQMKEKLKTQEEEIIVLENQELINVRITKMLGNEMTGSVVNENNSLGEVKTWLIPVGTQVVTKLGTTTTFVRLRSGDTVQMLIGKDAEEDSSIFKIWIIQ